VLWMAANEGIVTGQALHHNGNAQGVKLFFFLAVLGFELRTLCLLGHTTTTPPASPFCF
jgi:hypothetical protein